MNYQQQPYNNPYGRPPAQPYGAQPQYGVPPQGYAQPGQGYVPGTAAGPMDLYGQAHYEGSLSDPAVLAFTKRVYGYFTAALLTSTVACIGGMEAANYMIANGQAKTVQGLGIGAFVAFFVSYLVVVFTRKAHSPLKTGLLFVFAASAGFMLTPLVSAFVQAGAAMTVVFAFGITTTIFFGLTVFTLTTGKDFRSLGGLLLGGLILLIGVGLMSIFVPLGNGIQFLSLIGGVVIFSGFILFDTSMVTRNYFYTGDAVGAAIQLFYDFWAIFYRILLILGNSRR